LERANRDITPRLAEIFSEPVNPELIASLLKDDDLLTALRYLCAPPISKDDLETLVGESLAWTQVEKSHDRARAIRDVIVAVLDPKRFPWISERRSPSKSEVDKAILAPTVVASSQRVQTIRRGDERTMLQGAVEKILLEVGFQKSKSSHSIKNLRSDAPAPNEYMTEVLVGEHNADLVVGLRDYRVLAIECKGSNSEINSRKRINKEVAQDARDWIERFGSDNLVPAAAIQGVFSPRYVFQAQETQSCFFGAIVWRTCGGFWRRRRQLRLVQSGMRSGIGVGFPPQEWCWKKWKMG
jgi:XamI restriction endonuclease